MLVGQVRQAGEHIAQVGIRFDATAPATFDDGVNYCAACAGVGFPDEQPVLFSKRRGPDRVFDEIVVELDTAIDQEHLLLRI